MNGADPSKLFLFVVLSLVVLVMISTKQRPTASTPLDGATSVTDVPNTPDISASRGAGYAGIPNGGCPPLSLMMPVTGVQPFDADNG